MWLRLALCLLLSAPLRAALGSDECLLNLSLLSKSEIEKTVSQQLDAHLRLVSERSAKKIIGRVSAKIKSSSISEADLLQTTGYFYDSLQGSWIKRLLNSFSQEGAERELHQAEAFNKAVHEFLNSHGVKLSQSRWARARLWMIRNQTPLTWAKSLAVSATVSWAQYQATGQFFLLPVMWPSLFTPQFDGLKSRLFFANRVYQSLVSTFYAIALSYFVLNPTPIQDVFESLREDQLQTEQAQSRIQKTLDQLNQSESMATETQKLLDEIDRELMKRKTPSYAGHN
ncbi:MAG: hypothetical protein IT289_07675 [Oligoflexia bacterium]|nr:hypothetical protein [Oligoflexia bacterium]